MLSAIAITAYTATILVHADSAKYHLGQPVDWSLNGGVQSGRTDVVPVFIEGLSPDTSYEFSALDQTVTFHTNRCAGLIHATDFGVSEKSADNAAAFAKAIDAVPLGGTLTLAPGRYATGPIFLKSDMTLFVPEGAEISAISDRANWPILSAHTGQAGDQFGTWEGLPEDCFAAPVTALACNNLTITGGGVLDGGGDRGDWWDWPKETRQGARRPRTLFLAQCREVILSGMTIRNSPSWTVHPFKCTGMTVAALHIENPANSPNTDGFNPESSCHVDVKGVRISVGDDCIAIKAGKRGTGADTRVDHIAPTRHLTIENCLMQDGHGAIVCGSEMSGDISDVAITRCAFVGTDRGLRIKTRRGRGGQVSRITMHDVKMDGVGTALAANALYFCDADGKSDHVQSRDPAPIDDTTPRIADIVVDTVTMTGVRHAAGAFLGLPEAPITGLCLRNITVSYDADAAAGETLMACNLPLVHHGGILHRFAEVETDAPLRELLTDLVDAN